MSEIYLDMIPIKTKQEIEIMKEGGRILALIMEKLKPLVKTGVSTNELNRAAEALIFEYKVESAFLNYKDKDAPDSKPFPAVLCTSVNNIVVHAAPSEYKLKQGDILSLDLGIKYKGYYSDMAITLLVGDVSPEILRFIKITKKSLRFALAKAKPGNTFGDIGNTVQRFIEYQGFNVVRDLTGHGIGKGLHEEPKIPNFGKRRSGEKLKEGMVFCIEPMTTIGDWHLKKSADGFGYETADGSLSAHFEHTVAITETGCEVLTKV